MTGKIFMGFLFYSLVRLTTNCYKYNFGLNLLSAEKCPDQFTTSRRTQTMFNMDVLYYLWTNAQMLNVQIDIRIEQMNWALD
jgi:hypothetical protein